MREIKFRAWDYELKKMILPQEICHLDGEVTKGIQESSPYWELMQYTGLHDRNGKEIYEGDIITVNNMNDSYAVNYIEGAFVFGKNKFNLFCGHETEVIGNIYEGKKYRLKEFDIKKESIENLNNSSW